MQLIKQKKEKRERERPGQGERGKPSSSHCEDGMLKSVYSASGTELLHFGDAAGDRRKMECKPNARLLF